MRRISSTFAAVCAIGALAAVTAAPAAAQGIVEDRLTYVTFSGPVAIPGTTLPAGTYALRLADSQSDRHIVQVMDKAQMKLYATLLAVPATRPEPTGDPVITFKETPSDQPPAVHYWYYAGELSGNELVYPKNQALQIARASGQPVMAVDTDSKDIDDWKKGEVSRVTPEMANADEQPASPAPAAATATQPPSTTAEPAAQAQAAQPNPPASTPDTTPAEPRPAATSGRTELPKTASRLPMIGLIGLFALGGALTLRMTRRASV